MVKDKSKGKKNSSRIMWAIALCLDTHQENAWRNMPMAEKKPLLAVDILEDKDFDWDSIGHFMDEYLNRVMTIPQKELLNYQNKMKDRQKFIDGTSYTLDTYADGKTQKGTADQLDKMMVNTVKIYQQYEELKTKFEKAEEKGRLRGDRQESLGEQKII
tara:strand:- start:229 stop:705 length:477 start_codon:yes stop_codon:yes gene_type:complete